MISYIWREGDNMIIAGSVRSGQADKTDKTEA